MLAVAPRSATRCIYPCEMSPCGEPAGRGCLRGPVCTWEGEAGTFRIWCQSHVSQTLKGLQVPPLFSLVEQVVKCQPSEFPRPARGHSLRSDGPGGLVKVVSPSPTWPFSPTARRIPLPSTAFPSSGMRPLYGPRVVQWRGCFVVTLQGDNVNWCFVVHRALIHVPAQ